MNKATIQAAPNANTELQETSNKLLDYLGQILDAKEVMRASGIPHADFKTMFAQFASARVQHDSDCSLHNMPAYPAGPCDCSAAPMVADPAGVAVGKLRYERVNGDWEVCIFDDDLVKDGDLIYLAATVKAVPSEGCHK